MKMSYLKHTGCVLACLILSGCIERKPVKSPIISTTIMDRTGDVIGSARISENLQGGINLVVDARNINPGEHGIHFHDIGDCSADNFSSSGGHINPDGKKHGLNHEDGPDHGDMPNAIADEEGIISYAIFNKRVSMYGEGGLPSLFDHNGSALIIHLYPDDQKTQPAGGSGPRIACAVIGGPQSETETDNTTAPE